MTTPALYQGKVVQPTATATKAHAAAARLGEVLKDVLHRSGTYATEEALRLAEQAVTDWVSSVVPASAMAALDGEVNRAPYEDPSKRVPPGGAPVVVSSGPAIDYDKLAAAIMAAQAAAQRQAVE